MEQKRFYNIDFLKFLCCITILIVHLPLMNLEAPSIGRTDIGVAFFFMLSGFFLYFSFVKKISLVDFVVKRWIRLMPVVLASVLVVILLHKTGLPFPPSDLAFFGRTDDLIKLFGIPLMTRKQAYWNLKD